VSRDGCDDIVGTEAHTVRVTNEEVTRPGADAAASALTRAARTAQIERLVRGVEDWTEPIWRRSGRGESRWPVTVAMLVAIALQFALPERFAFGPRWFLPALQFAVVVALVVASPMRFERRSRWLRVASLGLIAVVSFGNAFAAFRLVRGLVQGTEGQDAGHLLATGAAIWLTNVVVFALWYWDLDRGGPAARARGTQALPAFLFVQMQTPDVAPPDWRPKFVDYLYLSFTNATAFSPTDVMPLPAWAKLTMMSQSMISLATVALVVARAVNILK